MSTPKELQQLEDQMSESGKKQLENIKSAVGLFSSNDSTLAFFTALQFIYDRFERFGSKFADTVRQSAHESRESAIKGGNVAFDAVIESKLKEFVDDIIHYSKQQILITRQLVEEEAKNRKQDDRKYVTIALFLFVVIFSFGVFGGIGLERYLLNREDKGQIVEQVLTSEPNQSQIPSKPKKK